MRLSKDWKDFALIGLCNVVLPFILIAVETKQVDSYLAAILMSTTPISVLFMAHYFIKDENEFSKSIGILIGFSGIIFLFLDKVIINDSNILFALIILFGSTFYSVGGILTLRIKKRGNENVVTSTVLWSIIFLIPLSVIFESPWNSSPTLGSTLL